MAVLRAVGAGPKSIVALLSAGQPVVEAQVGLLIPIRPPGSVERLFLAAVVFRTAMDQ